MLLTSTPEKGDNMLEDSDQVQQRMLKLERLRERGIDPYPARAHRSHTAAEAIAAFEEAEASGADGPTVQVAGRLRAIRVMGKSTFAHIEDGSGRIQIYLKRDNLGEEAYEIFKRDVDLGDFLGVEGRLFRTRTHPHRRGDGIRPVLSTADQDPPSVA